MTGDTVCLLALLAGGVVPAAAVACRGEAGDRLVGLQLASSATVLALVLFALVPPGQTYELIVPLVLAATSVAGTLVFTRLLGRRRDPS